MPTWTLPINDLLPKISIFVPKSPLEKYLLKTQTLKLKLKLR